MMPVLSKQEQQLLSVLEGKMQHVRDAIRGVVKSFHTGLILWGEGGTSKSYTVLDELQKLDARYVYHNTRLTARGLVDSLERNPNNIHLIEDAETLLDDKKSYGVLRSALWSQDKKKPPEREITWTAFQTEIRFIFTGGIIIISNANIADEIPELRAIKTRINVLGMNVSNEEIKVRMKKICMDGYRYGEDFMTPEECWEVCTYIIAKFDKNPDAAKRLDLRVLINGFKDYLQWKAGHSVSHWQSLLDGRMEQQVVFTARKDIKNRESQIALEIFKMNNSSKDKVALWKEKTGLEQAAYYRALKRMNKKG